MPVPCLLVASHDMDLICFTKLLQPYGADELIAFARRTGLAGYDLTVRDGHPVTPETIGTDLVPFVRQLTDAGLQVPLATIGGTALPAGDPATESAWAACAEAGIGMIKLGYWHWTRESPHYWDHVDSVRAELHQYARLAEKFGVTAVFHTHSSHPWGTPPVLNAPYGFSASSLMHLIADIDPRHVGAYIDPAHLSLDGEPLELALDILKDRVAIVAIVAVKNMVYHPTADGDTTVWSHEACPLPAGLVDWRAAIASLRTAGYGGWLNLHAEYNGRYAPVVPHVVDGPVVDGDGRTRTMPQPWKLDPTGNLAETTPVLDLLEPDIAYLAKIVAGS